jgi:hypothetical protein
VIFILLCGSINLKQQNMTNSILKTIIYFDIFNTPLTREEIFRWLWSNNNTSYIDIFQKLDYLVDNKKIEYKNGYYFLPDRSEIIDTRQKSIHIVEEKIKIAKRACKKLRWIPFLEAVFVCNTVAGGGVKKSSDIDVFIVIKKGRMWLSRFLTTLTMSVFKLRRSKKNITNKICLSFYATDEALNLSGIKINDPDIYLIYWIDNLIPIYDPKNTAKKIIHQNLWAKKYLPNSFSKYEILPRWKIENSKTSKTFRSFFEKAWEGSYGDLVESQSKNIQQTKMKLSFSNSHKTNGLGVIINDKMLKFHENDRREQFKNRWNEKCELLCKTS